MSENNEMIKMYKGNKEYDLTIEGLRTEISQCLQIDNLNFLIGAGCSSFIGSDGVEKAIPTMAGLAKLFYNEYPDFKIASKEKAVDRFPDNLEALINHLISIANIAKDKNRITVMNKVKTINQFIFDHVCNAIQSTELLSLYKEFYLRIVKKTRQTPVNIYTTNYDLYNENALDELGFMYNNGFLGSAKRIFNPNSYNYVVVENLNLSRDVWKSVSNFINLYKIHGSINWVKEKNEATETDYILEKDIDLIRQRKQYGELMIYPTPQKDRSTLMVPYSDLFRMMQNNLLRSNSILITMGYSFSDDHINRIILNALSVYDFKLVIFGDSDKIRKLKDIGDSRIWIINSNDKIHYFANLVQKALPSLDDEIKEAMAIKKSLHKLAALISEDTPDE